MAGYSGVSAIALQAGLFSRTTEQSNAKDAQQQKLSMSRPAPSTAKASDAKKTEISQAVPPKAAPKLRFARKVTADNFEPTEHYYPKVLNAEQHPMVSNFFHLTLKRIAERYSHLHPNVDKNVLIQVLKQPPSHLRWSGADLFVTTTSQGQRKLTVIETNTCPSGQKSMPRSDSKLNEGFGYQTLIRNTFKPMLNDLPPELYSGALAVVYDKNKMEASGYAHAMADVFREDVYMVEFYNDDKDPPVRFDKDGVMSIRDENGKWLKVRAAFRYVTQNP